MRNLMVKCKWCGELTYNNGTKECDHHWELRHRIEQDLDMTYKMYLTLWQEKLNKLPSALKGVIK